jgi:hypothetical protein
MEVDMAAMQMATMQKIRMEMPAMCILRVGVVAITMITISQQMTCVVFVEVVFSAKIKMGLRGIAGDKTAAITLLTVIIATTTMTMTSPRRQCAVGAVVVRLPQSVLQAKLHAANLGIMIMAHFTSEKCATLQTPHALATLGRQRVLMDLALILLMELVLALPTRLDAT